MEIEFSENYRSLMLLLGDDGYGMTPLLEKDTSEYFSEITLSSAGEQPYAQHPTGQLERREGQPTRLDEPLAFTAVPEGATETPQGDAALGSQRKARGFSMRERMFFLGGPLLLPPPQEINTHVSEHEVSIRVEVQSILCNLVVGTELRDYTYIATALRPLADKLGVNVLITGGESQGYHSLGTTETPDAFNIHDDKNILTSGDLGNRAVVISTPEMKSSQWKTVIPEMAQILESSFEMTFNASTGLHVNIGIGRAYTLKDIKRVCKAIMLFERQMNTYHPKSRSPASPTRSLDYFQILPCRDSPYLHWLTDMEVIRKINTAGSILELIWVMNRDDLMYNGKYQRGYRYNLRNVIRSKKIEFRQAVGTIQSYRIIDWVKKVIIFVRAAITTEDSEFDDWAENGTQDIGIYYRFAVPPPDIGSRPLRVRIPIPKKRARFLMTTKQIVFGKRRRKDIWLFEKVRAGNVGQGLFWFVYRWRKVDGGLKQLILSRRASFFSSTVVVILKPNVDWVTAEDLESIDCL